MTEITFNITGIGNLIEELKVTRCHCGNEHCNNNSAWSGRNVSFPPRCLLSHVQLGRCGECDENSDIEASIKAQELLKRVSNDAGDFSKAEGSYQIPGKLFKEIFDHVNALEE